MNEASATASASRAATLESMIPPSLRGRIRASASPDSMFAFTVAPFHRSAALSDSSDDEMPPLLPHPDAASAAARRRSPRFTHPPAAAAAPPAASASSSTRFPGTRRSMPRRAPPPAASAAAPHDAAGFASSARFTLSSRAPRQATAAAAPTTFRTERAGRVSRRAAPAAATSAAGRSEPPVTRTRGTKRTRFQPDRPSKRVTLKKPPPSSPASGPEGKPKAEDPEEDKKPSAVASEAATCTICMCEPERSEVSTIDGCEHLYCFSCIDQWSERENTCPLCKARFCKIKRVHPQRRKRGSSTPAKNTKKVKNRDQRSDILPSAALEGILANIASSYSRGDGPSQLDRFIIAHVGGNPGAAGSRSRGVMAARISTSGGANAFAPHPFFGMGMDDDDDAGDEVMGHFIPSFMGAILRSSSQARRAASSSSSGPRSEAGRMFAAGFGPPRFAARRTGPPPPPNMPELFARSHASNAADSSAGQAASNPLEIDDSDDDDEVEVVGFRSR